MRGWFLWVVLLGGLTACAGMRSEAATADSAAEGHGYDYGAAPAAPPPPDESSRGYGFDYTGSQAAPRSKADDGELESFSDTVGLVPGDGAAAEPGSDATAQPAKQLLLIYKAHLVLAVFETKRVLDRVEVLARELGGYLVQRSDDTIVIRVPVARFERGLQDASGLGDELSRQVSTDDVSDQYRDLKIRLKNAEVVRERFEALLAKAQDVKDALLVEEQLARITNTIEQLKGRLKMLDELVAFSTITVTLQPRAVPVRPKQRVTLPFPWLRELGLSNLLDLEER